MGTFLYCTLGQRGNYATTGLQLSARSAHSPVQQQQQLWEKIKNLPEEKSRSTGSPRNCYNWTTAAPAFPASPKASKIVQVWDSQGKFCYALQRNVPPTAVVSSHKRIISEIISEGRGIVCRFHWNIAPGRGSQMSQTILRLFAFGGNSRAKFQKGRCFELGNWLCFVGKGAFLPLELLK